MYDTMTKTRSLMEQPPYIKSGQRHSVHPGGDLGGLPVLGRKYEQKIRVKMTAWGPSDYIVKALFVRNISTLLGSPLEKTYTFGA